jgi:hypothetical protein
MAKTSSDQSEQFNTMLLTAAIIAALLALCIVGTLYGCARETNNKPKLQPPATFVVSLPR